MFSSVVWTMQWSPRRQDTSAEPGSWCANLSGSGPCLHHVAWGLCVAADAVKDVGFAVSASWAIFIYLFICLLLFLLYLFRSLLFFLDYFLLFFIFMCMIKNKLFTYIVFSLFLLFVVILLILLLLLFMFSFSFWIDVITVSDHVIVINIVFFI